MEDKIRITCDLTPEFYARLNNAIVHDLGYKHGNRKIAIIKALTIYCESIEAKLTHSK